MSIVAEAFVAIRPDTKGFAAELQKQLRDEIKLVTPPTIKVKPVVIQASLVALRREIAAKPARMPVQLVLAGGAKALRAQIIAAAGGPIPIKVVATATRAAGSVAGAAAAGGGGRRSAAMTSEEALLALTRQVTSAETAAAKRTFDKAKAQDVLRQSTNALNVAVKRLNLEEEKGTAITQAQAGDLVRRAEQAQKTAALRVETINRTAQARGVKLDPAADAKGAAAQLRTASAAGIEDEKLLAAAVDLANGSLERQVRALIAVRKKTFEAAGAIKAGADIQAEATRERIAAEKAEQKVIADQASAATAKAKQDADALLKQQNAAERIQRRIDQNLANQAQVPHAGAAAKTDFETSTKRLAAAQAAATAAERNLTAAIANGTPATIAAATQADVLAKDLLKVEAAAVAAGRALRDQIPAQTAIHRIEQSIAKGTPGAATGAQPLERARKEANAAALAGRQLDAVNTRVAAGELKVTKAQEARLLTLRAEVALIEQATVANLALAQSEAKEAVTKGQQTRAALATTASFTGLRGAVLSSSLPFLLVTAGITAVTKAVGSASELQQSLNVFQASVGASGDEMERVRELAKELGKDLRLPATSANDAATAMLELGKAGLSVSDSMAAARGVLQLSAAASLSAADAAIIAATALNSFGLAGDQAEKVTNLFAGASIAAQGGIQDFGFALQQVAAQAHQAGLSVDQTLAALTQLAKAGIRGSDAGTSLRVELLKLVPGTKPAAEAFRLLGIQIDKSKTIGDQFLSIIDQFSTSLATFKPQQQTDIIRDIFGQDAGRAAFITLTQGSARFQEVQNQISKAGNAAALTEARAKGLSGAMDGLSSRTEDLAASVGQNLLPFIESFTRALSDATGGADDLISALEPLTKIAGAGIDIGVGGGDFFGQAAFTAAAVIGIKKLREFRAAKKEALTGEGLERDTIGGGGDRAGKAAADLEVETLARVQKAASSGTRSQTAGQTLVTRAVGRTVGALRGLTTAYADTTKAAGASSTAGVERDLLAAEAQVLAQDTVRKGVVGTVGALGNIDKAYLENEVVAKVSAEAQIASLRSTQLVATEVGGSIRAMGGGWLVTADKAEKAGERIKKVDKGIVASAFSRAQGVLAANRGLALGIAALFATQQLERVGGTVGKAGAIVGAAASGALVGGSVAGAPGAVIGGVAAAAVTYFNQVKKEHDAANAKALDAWNALTQDQQLVALQGMRGGLSSLPGLGPFKLKPGETKTSPPLPGRNLQGQRIDPHGAEAAELKARFETAQDFLTRIKGSVKPSSKALQDEVARGFFTDFTNLGIGALPKTVPGSRNPDGTPRFIADPRSSSPLVGQGKSAVTRESLRQKVLPGIQLFGPTMKGIAADVFEAPPAGVVGAEKRNIQMWADLLGGHAERVALSIKIRANKFDRGRDIQELFNLAGTNEETAAAAQAEILHQSQIFGRFTKLSSREINALTGYTRTAEDLAKAADKATAAQNAVNQAVDAFLSAVTATPHNLVIAGIIAERTPTAADDIANLEKIAARDQRNLDDFTRKAQARASRAAREGPAGAGQPGPGAGFGADKQAQADKKIKEGLREKAERSKTDAELARQSEADRLAAERKSAAADAESAADEARQAQELRLRRAADAVGNQGKAEAALLAFLQKQIDIAKAGSLAREQAINDYNQEVKNARDIKAGNLQALATLGDSFVDIAEVQKVLAEQGFKTVAAVLKELRAGYKKIIADVHATSAEKIAAASALIGFDTAVKDANQALTDAKLDRAEHIASRTPGDKDDKKVLQDRIDDKTKLIKQIEDLAHKTTAQKTALVKLQDEREGLEAQLKGLEAGGSFTLNDLFKESDRLLSEFGSNISLSPTTTGANRQRLAAGIAAARPDQTITSPLGQRKMGSGRGVESPLADRRMGPGFVTQKPTDRTDPIGRAVAAGAEKQVSATTKTNVWLEKIYNEIRSGNPNLKPKPKPKPGEKTADDQAKFAVAGVGGM